MRALALVATMVVLIVAAACSTQPSPSSATRVADLGHALSPADPTWSGNPAFARTTLATFDTAGYEAGHVEVDEHFGTHVDAPSHFGKGGATVDQIPPDRLVRPGVCLNITARITGHEDYALTVEDIKTFEDANRAVIPADAIVLIATGWDARWPEGAQYMNVRNGVKHFPGISEAAATLLARDRRVAGIGIDTPSIDVGPSSSFEAHRATQSLGVYHIENAANLTTLPAMGFTVVVAPMKIKGGSGGPARVFALLPAPTQNR